MNSELSRQKVEISLDGVCKVFGKKGRQVTVLQDITFDVHQNEFVSLLGPSGCGKSTLLRIMADLLQPSSGQIIIEKEHPRKYVCAESSELYCSNQRYLSGEPCRRMLNFLLRYWVKAVRSIDIQSISCLKRLV